MKTRVIVAVLIAAAVLGAGAAVWAIRRADLSGSFYVDANGKAHGTGRKTYRYPFGTVKLVEEYRQGKQVRSEWFKPDGTSLWVTVWEAESGVGLHVRDDGSLRNRMTYVHGIAHGPATYYRPDGSVEGEAVFQNGVRVSGYDPGASN